MDVGVVWMVGVLSDKEESFFDGVCELLEMSFFGADFVVAVCSFRIGILFPSGDDMMFDCEVGVLWFDELLDVGGEFGDGLCVCELAGVCAGVSAGEADEG